MATVDQAMSFMLEGYGCSVRNSQMLAEQLRLCPDDQPNRKEALVKQLAAAIEEECV
jgi:hypothetical protein